MPRDHYDWLADSRIVSFRLVDAHVEPSLAEPDLQRSTRITKVSRLLGWLPAFVRRLLVGAFARLVYPTVEAQPDDHGWVGKRAAVTVEPDDDGRVTLACECPAWPFGEPLEVTVTHDGDVLTVTRALVGPFTLSFRVPRRGPGPVTVLLSANRAFSPREHGLSQDWRAVSFRVVSGIVAATSARVA